MKIDEPTNELNGKIQFITSFLIAINGDPEKFSDIGIDWRKEAVTLAEMTEELIERLGLPVWELTDNSHERN